MGRTSREGFVSYRSARDVVFLECRDTVFCAECELISYNNSPRCLACGSTALLSLARVLGGSLRGEQTARLVGAEALDRVIGEVLKPSDAVAGENGAQPYAPSANPQLQYAAAAQVGGEALAALRLGVERACGWTGASGAAAAIAEGGRMVCRARAGNAPDLEVEVRDDGLTSLCVRTQQLWRCDDTEHEPWVNRDACRGLGIRSMVVAPVMLLRRVLGVLEVFSPSRAAFDDHHVATVQLVASAMAVAVVRDSTSTTVHRPRLRGSRNDELPSNDAHPRGFET